MIDVPSVAMMVVNCQTGRDSKWWMTMRSITTPSRKTATTAMTVDRVGSMPSTA